ncbi:hypothetical protein [Nocardia asteroides]|uniref:hypothetical protein n=1 Tax=Nocardia asteroides TaxID=1824 RepID=UPI001E323BB7|nr:hypothetical protein [Nocardia asteroides]UGT53618.1 hypothetical protein LTT85_23440 [Nocardia asteroides]
MSLADRYLDLIAEMKRVGWHPDQQRLDEIGAELVELDHLLETSGMTDLDYDRLDKMRGMAHHLLTEARSDHHIALAVAAAARKREAHDAAHPTILNPERSALADWSGGNAVDRSLRERARGYDRER